MGVGAVIVVVWMESSHTLPYSSPPPIPDHKLLLQPQHARSGDLAIFSSSYLAKRISTGSSVCWRTHDRRSALPYRAFQRIRVILTSNHVLTLPLPFQRLRLIPPTLRVFWVSRLVAAGLVGGVDEWPLQLTLQELGSNVR